MSDDDRIDYIKGSLDLLHEKIDKVYMDSDTRLKVLETDKAHEKGFRKALYLVCGIIGASVSCVFSYLSGKN